MQGMLSRGRLREVGERGAIEYAVLWHVPIEHSDGLGGQQRPESLWQIAGDALDIGETRHALEQVA